MGVCFSKNKTEKKQQCLLHSLEKKEQDKDVYPELFSCSVVYVNDGSSINVRARLKKTTAFYQFTLCPAGLLSANSRSMWSYERECALLTKMFVRKNLLGKEISTRITGRTQRGKLLAMIVCGNFNLNRELKRLGFACDLSHDKNIDYSNRLKGINPFCL